jgi:hypothetical protein
MVETHGVELGSDEVLRETSGPKIGELIVQWRKLYNAEFQNLHINPLTPNDL